MNTTTKYHKTTTKMSAATFESFVKFDRGQCLAFIVIFHSYMYSTCICYYGYFMLSWTLLWPSDVNSTVCLFDDCISVYLFFLPTHSLTMNVWMLIWFRLLQCNADWSPAWVHSIEMLKTLSRSWYLLLEKQCIWLVLVSKMESICNLIFLLLSNFYYEYSRSNVIIWIGCILLELKKIGLCFQGKFIWRCKIAGIKWKKLYPSNDHFLTAIIFSI